MEDRKGFLTPEQEEKLDRVIELKGIYEAMDGPAIRIADNKGLEALKKKIVEQYPAVLPIVYEVVDAIMEVIPDVEEVNE